METFIGAAAGALSGYLISRYMQSRSLTSCTILCNPRISIIYFGLLGALVASA